MIAATTISIGAVSAFAEDAPPGGKPVEAPAASTAPGGTAPPAPLSPPAGSAPATAQSTPAPTGTASPAPAQPPVLPTGTPATVLDTADYEGVLGKAVRSATGEDMGRIIDIILDKDGRPRAAIIDFGGFLGVGSRKIAVDWRSMRFTSDGKPTRLVLQLSRNQVRVSPEYKAGEPIVVLGPASPAVSEGEQQVTTAGSSAPAPSSVAAPAPAAAPPAPAAEKTPEKPAERTPDK